jgi:hypothetical protein
MMLMERNGIARMEAQLRDAGTNPASFESLEELVGTMVRDVETLQQELDQLVTGIRSADPHDQSAALANEVRVEGLLQARGFVVRAHQVAQRAGEAAQRMAPRVAAPPSAVADPAPVPPGTPPAHSLSWSGTPSNTPHPYDLEPAAPNEHPSPAAALPLADAHSPFNSNGGALELSVLPPDGEFQRYRIDGPLTFAAMLALKQAVAQLRGVSSVRVAPRPDGGTVLTLISQDPDLTTRDLQNVPGFMMRLVAV